MLRSIDFIEHIIPQQDYNTGDGAASRKIAGFDHQSGHTDFSINVIHNKIRELELEGLFIMNLYKLDKQSTKFTIWKY